MGGVAAEQTSYSVVMLRKGGMEDGYRKKGGPQTLKLMQTVIDIQQVLAHTTKTFTVAVPSLQPLIKTASAILGIQSLLRTQTTEAGCSIGTQFSAGPQFSVVTRYSVPSHVIRSL